MANSSITFIKRSAIISTIVALTGTATAVAAPGSFKHERGQTSYDFKFSDHGQNRSQVVFQLAQVRLEPLDTSLTPTQAYSLAVNYTFGRNGYPKDPALAARLYYQAAEANYAPAIYNLGLAFRRGLGVRRNNNEAVRLYRKAISLGHKGALNNMGFMHENGYGVARDLNEAMRFYTRAADRGHKLAQDNVVRLRRKMARLSSQGGGGSSSTAGTSNTQSRYVFRDPGRLPIYDATLSTTQAFNEGVKFDLGRDGYPQDRFAAAQLFHQAARGGHIASQYNLGHLYQRGQGVKKDYHASIYWMRKAADRNYAKAQYFIGVMHRNGWGTPKSNNRAIYWYRRAAAQNHGSSLNNMGFMYENGYGVVKNRQTALSYYRRAGRVDNALGKKNFARLNKILNPGSTETVDGSGGGGTRQLPPYDASLSTNQAFNLGRAFYFGRDGRRRDYFAAAKLFNQAAKNGHAPSQLFLGISYNLGRGVTKNKNEALHWFRKSANRGIPGALYSVGHAYHKGEGVRQNYKEAVRWYRRAANKGFPAALNNLGFMYENGYGVPRNREEARYYYQQASDKGFDLARQNLERMDGYTQ